VARGARADHHRGLIRNDAMQALEISHAVEDISPDNDYARIRAALEFIGAQAKRQPSIEEIAAHVGLSPSHLHHLFQRWAGLTPKAFLQAVTIDHARRLLRDNASLLEASLELGLSGPSRLHDLFVTQDMMTPGEFKTGGAGLTFSYGFHPSPFGEAIAVVAPRGLAGMGFVDEAGREAALADMQRRWPKAAFHEDAAATAPYVRRAFDPAHWRADQPLRIVLIGSDFEVQVWRALLKVPLGAATTYSDVASEIGRPGAARAVGAAVGRNPISFVVPCHRVIGRSGALTGYHWGVVRKQAIIGWEAGRFGAV
jgi:AraC family transcriptional regulator of adaptative response/methylated-DNA-[protein]-cysteine methyltransferase